jgi:DNA repair exonuclease SbcCD ATPase subunit
MKITSVRARNFRTLADVRLDLDRPAGLYFMTGRNLDRPRLGSNGIGKSSLFNALYWSLYGVTTDGMRAEGLCGPAGSAYSAMVKMQVAERTEKVYRGWNPNRLLRDGRPVSAVSDLVRLSPEEFQATVLMCQSGEMLLDFTPAKRLELVGASLNLDIWSEHSRAAQLRAAKLAEQHARLEEWRVGKEAVITALRELDVSSKLKAWERDRKKNLRAMKARLTDQKAALATLTAAFKKVVKEKEAVEEKIKRLAPTSVSGHDDTGDRDKQLAAVTRATVELEAIKKQLKQFCVYEDGQWHATTHCDACGSDLTHKQVKKRIEILLVLSRAAIAKKDEASLVLETADKRRERDRRAEERKANFLADLERERKDAGDRSLNLMFEINRVTTLCKDLRSNIAKERHAKNPYADQEESRLRKLHMARIQLANINEEREFAHRRHDRAEWWVRGFKEVRYYVLQEALNELTAVTQMHAQQMGMKGFNVVFIAERENKSGSTSNTFDVQIHTPYRKEPMPLRALSGGEQARLRLASAFAGSDLILRRRNVLCNLEVYDEPTQHLSPEGIEDVIGILRNRALVSGRQIWFVDHHSISSGRFDDIVYLELKDNQTRIVT